MASAISSPEVAAVFSSYPPAMRRRVLALRALILDTAKTPGVGPLEEALRWGEPAYLTRVSKSGSTIRIAWKPSAPERCAMYFNCQTNLVATFRRRFGAKERVPAKELRRCIAMALTHHRARLVRG